MKLKYIRRFLAITIIAIATGNANASIGVPVMIGTNGNTTASTSLAITVTNVGGVSVGNTVIVAMAMTNRSGGVIAVDSRGNTYSVDADTNGTIRTVIISAPVTSALLVNDVITLTFSSVGPKAASAFFVSGLVSASRVDKTATASGSSTAPSSGATTATTMVNELLVGAIGMQARNSTTFTPGASFTALSPSYGDTGASASSAAILPEYRIVSATGAYAASGTLSASRVWSAAIVAYRAGLPATATTVATSGNPTTYGDAVTFTATVLPTNATGTVNFYDGVTLLGSGTLMLAAENTASYTTTNIQLSAIAHTNITAVYQGDNNNTASTSLAITQIVNKLALSVAGLTGVSRIYNGITSATIYSNNVTLSGVIVGDTIMVRTNGYVAIFADRHVGTNKVVTMSGLSLAGNATNNYIETSEKSRLSCLF